MYMTTQKSFSMCVYYIRTEDPARNTPLYISVNESWKQLLFIVNVLTLLQYRHLPNLNAASSVIVTKKKVLLTSEERTDVELQAGHILVILLHNYLFLNLFAHMSQNPSSFKFKY